MWCAMVCNPSKRAGARHDNAVQHAQPDVLRRQHRLWRREVRDLQVVHDKGVTWLGFGFGFGLGLGLG